MKYTSVFENIEGQRYAVVITTEGVSAPAREVTAGASPFTTEMAENDNIYTPSRLTTAKVELMQDNGKDFMMDMYSGSAHGTKVELLTPSDGGNYSYTDSEGIHNAEVIWTGYATPVTYDGDYNGEHDTVTLECVDGLATLKNMKYKRTGKMISFLSLIRNILQRCDCYNTFYFSAATHLPGLETSIIEDAFISEQNFFSAKDDTKQSDDDVAWTCLDVLEEICRFFNVFVTAWEDSVYFIDIDAVKHGIDEFWKYSVDGTKSWGKVVVSDLITVDGSLYSSSGGTLSLDEVYNKVSVKSNFSTYENVIPEIFSLAENVTKDHDVDKETRQTVDANGMGAVIYSSLQSYGEDKKNMEVLFIAPFNDVYAGFFKYYKSPYYKCHRYTWKNGKLTENNIDEVNFTDTQNSYGAYLVKTYTLKVWDRLVADKMFELLVSLGLSQADIIQMALDNANSGSVSLEDTIMLCNPSPHHISNYDMLKYPFFETENIEGLGLAGGKDVFIVISGTYRFQKYEAPFMSDSEEDLGHGRYAAKVEDCHLVAKLKWGDLYWSGDPSKGDNGWTREDCTFNIPYAKDGDNTRADNMMWKDVQIVNNVRWDCGVDLEGYYIPLPDATLISGLPKFTLYKPYDPQYYSTKSGESKGQYYKHNVVFLKDFKITLAKADPSREGNGDTDTTYTNIIDSNNASEGDEEDFKITTDDNKKPAYSNVAVKTGDGFVWLGDTHNDATCEGEKEWAVVDDDANASTSGDMRQEQHRIYRYVTQYSSPAVKLGFTARNIVKPWSLIYEPYIGKHLFLDAQNIDFKRAAAELSTREIK